MEILGTVVSGTKVIVTETLVAEDLNIRALCAGVSIKESVVS